MSNDLPTNQISPFIPYFHIAFGQIALFHLSPSFLSLLFGLHHALGSISLPITYNFCIYVKTLDEDVDFLALSQRETVIPAETENTVFLDA